MKNIKQYLLGAMILLLTACSDGEYTNVIPANSTAIIAAKAEEMMKEDSPFVNFVNIINKQHTDCGIDTEKEVYLFETADGMLGMCAAISDEEKLEETLKTVGQNNTEHKGVTYCMANTWVVGHNKSCLLIMGPVLPADRTKMIRRMTAFFEQDEETCIKTTPLWEHLNEVASTENSSEGMRFVAQADAMPEQMVAALMIGAPKGTDPADVLIEATITCKKDTVMLQGKNCSYNMNVKQSLEKSKQVYRPLSINWKEYMSDDALISIFMNVDGKEYMPLIQNNKTLNTMLMSTDAYDKIRENEGNMIITLTPKVSDSKESSYSASVKNSIKGTEQQDDRLVVVLNMNEKLYNGVIVLSLAK